MTYLILQILLFIILAAAVGFITGWLLHGHGLESKMMVTENEWRVKHHILQNESDRLQTELDDFKLNKASTPSTTNHDVEAGNEALPFKSAANRLPQDNPITSELVDQPLARLRAKLALIEEEEEEKLRPVTAETESHSTESHNDGQYHDEESVIEKDDLQQINGIDAVTEATLNSMGVYRYSQIAHFSEANIVWADEYTKFKKQIEKNNWVGQAKELTEEKPQFPPENLA